jgi:hypothetical protein
MRRLVVFLILELRTTTNTTSRLPRNPEPQMRIESLLYSTLLHLPPSDSTVPEDAGIKRRTVATSAALAVRRSLTTRLDRVILVHNLHQFPSDRLKP